MTEVLKVLDIEDKPIDIKEMATADIDDITFSQVKSVIEKRYDFSIVEKRALYFIICEVKRMFAERNEYDYNVFSQSMRLNINIDYLKNEEMSIKELYEELSKLRRKTICIHDKKRVACSGFISYYEHVHSESYIEFGVTYFAMAFYLKLSAYFNFTAYNITAALSLRQKYSKLIYELCAQHESNDPNPNNQYSGHFSATVKEFHEMMSIDIFTSNLGHAGIRRQVIDPAQNELKELYDAGQCNLYFELDVDKKDRRADDYLLHFYVYSNKKNKIFLTQELKNQLYLIEALFEKWFEVNKRPRCREWVSNSIAYLKMHPHLIPKLNARLERMKAETPRKHYAALARHILEEDFLP